MPAECVFTLPTGRKCRCMATRGHAFCRHHGAPAPPRRPAADPEIWNRRICWREFGRELPDVPAEEIPFCVLNLLEGLRAEYVSDRFAGRCLRILLRRLDALPLQVSPEFDQPYLPPPAPSRHAPQAAALDPNAAQLLRQCLAELAPGGR